MTHRATGSGRGIPRIWILPALGLTAILAVTAAGVLSRSLALDLLAWWPVWTLIVVVAFLVRGRRVGRARLDGLVPLVALAALAVFLVGHLSGWEIMPSASQRLIGPEVKGTTAASLEVMGGDIELSGGAHFLYEVEPVRRGGPFGIPDAVEEVAGESISISLQRPADPGFHSFSGWDISLSHAPAWDLTLGGSVSADLSGLTISRLQLTGQGSVTLGPVPVTVPASVAGVFELVVPDGVPLRIIGPATVPSTWEELADGWRSPIRGEGWVITVFEGAALSVTEET